MQTRGSKYSKSDNFFSNIAYLSPYSEVWPRYGLALSSLVVGKICLLLGSATFHIHFRLISSFSAMPPKEHFSNLGWRSPWWKTFILKKKRIDQPTAHTHLRCGTRFVWIWAMVSRTSLRLYNMIRAITGQWILVALILGQRRWANVGTALKQQGSAVRWTTRSFSVNWHRIE